MASGANTEVLFHPENPCGTLTGVLYERVCPTSIDGREETQTTQSGRICGGSRCPRVDRITQRNPAFSLGTELVYDETHFLYESALANATSFPGGAAIDVILPSIEWTVLAGPIYELDNAGTFNWNLFVEEGGSFWLSLGFLAAGNTGVFQVDTIVSPSVIRVSNKGWAVPPSNEGPVLATVRFVQGGGVFNGNSLITHAIAQRHLDDSIEFPFTGMLANSWAVDVSANALVTQQFELIGRELLDTRDIGVDDYFALVSTDAGSPSTLPYSTSENIWALCEGVPILEVPYCLRSFTFEVNNNGTNDPCIGQNTTACPELGTPTITGTATFVLDGNSVDLWEDGRLDNPVGFYLILAGPSPTPGDPGGSYVIWVPQAAITSVRAPVSDPDAKVELEVNWSSFCNDDNVAFRIDFLPGVTIDDFNALP